MRSHPDLSWSKKRLICYYVALLIGFMATFFAPVIGNPDTTMGRKDVVYGYEAAAMSWQLFFNSYDDVYKAIAPSQAARESVSDKTMIAAVLLYGSRVDGHGVQKGFRARDPWWSKLLVHAYSICLQFAWLCNAIPILLLLQMALRLPEPVRQLLGYSSFFLFILSSSFLVLQLLAWSWPAGGASSIGYFFWWLMISYMAPLSKEQRKAWPYSCG